MKKVSAILTCVLVMISAFVPLCYAVEETTSMPVYSEPLTDGTTLPADGVDKIESINIIYTLDINDAKPVTETQFKIYATTTSQSETSVDMTDDFEIGEVIWCKVVDTVDETLTADAYYEYDPTDTTATEFYLICTDQDILDSTSTYKVIIKDLKPADGMEFNYVGNDRIMINGNTIDRVQGSTVQNDNSNLFISFLSTGSGPIVKEPETEATEPETILETVSESTTEAEEEETEEERCSLCGVCPFQPQGICLFVWIGIIVVGIVVILILVKSLIKKDDDYDDYDD